MTRRASSPRKPVEVWIRCRHCPHVFLMSSNRDQAELQIGYQLCPMHMELARYERLAKNELGKSAPPQVPGMGEGPRYV